MKRRLASLAVLFLVACGGEGEPAAGGLGTGIAAVPDPTGRADYLVDFGLVEVGGERRRPWLLVNDGPEPVEAAVAFVAPPFALEGDPVRTVPAGSREELLFAFRPAAAGEAERIAEVASPGGGYRIRLAGRGTPSLLSCDPTGVVFGQVAPGETLRRTVLCENDGELPETVVIRPLSGPPAFRWDLPETGAAVPLAPGESLAVTVEFAPPAPGEYAASFDVEREAGGAVATILLLGTGGP